MKIGPYEVLGELGRGGMGVVYRAGDPALGRIVALKVLPAGSHPEYRERFLREGRVAARLRHPGIVSVHAAGVAEASGGPADAGAAYLVMDLIDGESLADLLDREALPPDRAARIVEAVARALAHAHAQGVIHRDVKPGNILLDKGGVPHLADFGLAREVEGGAALSQSGAAVGTPHYMSPEQLEARPGGVDARADIWACGIVLYECLAGERPFGGSTPVAVLTQVATREAPPLRAKAPQVPRDLETIVLRCLERDPARRYPTAEALADDLGRFVRGEPILARPASAFYRIRRHVARRKAAFVVALVAAAVLGAGAAVLLPRLGVAEREAEEARASATLRLREASEGALEAALALRRAGDLPGMRKYAERVERTCREAMRSMPDSPEPHYRHGRMLRALMRDEEALAEQERALAKEAGYGPALYERVVLVARLVRKRADALLEDALRVEGARLAEEGGGRVRPGAAAERPSRRALAAGDPKARELTAKLEADLRDLEARRSAVSPGSLACARGLRAWIAADPAEARRHLEAAVQSAPDLEEAYEALASLEEEEGRHEEAVRWSTAGSRRDQGYLPHLEGRARVRERWARERSGRGEDSGPLFEAAVEDYGEALARDPLRVESLVGRGGVRAAWAFQKEWRGQDPEPLYQEAVEDLGAAIAAAPGRDDAWAARGAARVLWAAYTGSHGRDPSALFEAAIADYGEALARNDARDDTWLGRANARCSWALYRHIRGEDPDALYEAGVADLAEALRKNPGRYEVWQRTGNLHVHWANWRRDHRKDPAPLYQAAVDHLTEAIRLDAKRVDGWLGRGVARMSAGYGEFSRGRDPGPFYGPAIADFDEAIARAPARDELWLRRGNARMYWSQWKARKKGDPEARPLVEAAIADQGEAISRNPGRDEPWMYRGNSRLNLAGLLRASGEDTLPTLAAAIEDLSRSVAVNPAFATAWRHRGLAHRERAQALAARGEPAAGEWRAALADFEEAIRQNASLRPSLKVAIEECRRAVGGADGPK
ncbi:MAG: serine/threonine protein kinase [Planctomycetales bacterium]|nr:serine/threonine protein kinase [Planctomycetales bacterium]